VVIALDRSGSMGDPAGGGQSKWQAATAAVNQLIADYGDNIRFGLALYSDDGGDSCTAGSVSVDPAAGTGPAISSALAGTSPSGKTPIGSTLAALAAYSGLEDTGRANYVLLLTDGEETCGGDGVASVTALRNKSTSVQTFVVGFGDGVDASALDAMATAAGTSSGGATDYYQANDANALRAAFDNIAADVLGCSYDLDEAPAEARDLIVYLDGARIEEDPAGANGWTYDAASNRLQFHGQACMTLRAATMKKLNVVRSCPFVVP
jgi:Ca-activated chloride channel family protein